MAVTIHCEADSRGKKGLVRSVAGKGLILSVTVTGNARVHGNRDRQFA